MVLGCPGGRFIVAAAVGAALIRAAGYFAVSSGHAEVAQAARLGISIGDNAALAVTVTAWAGWLGRGVVAALLGVFLVRAAWQFDAKEAVGVDGVWRRVRNDAVWGPFLLSVVAIGPSRSGVYSIIEARYLLVDES